MQTLGYRFRPWTEAKAIADGPSILDYVRDTAREAGIDRHIRFGHRVARAAWSTADARWTVCDRGPSPTVTCDFLYVCGGYYRYDEGYRPEFAGRRALRGRARPPAVLARGPRLRGQAGRRDRQRRHRGDARARADRPGRARDDAPALADATSSRSRPRTRSPTALRRVLGDRRGVPDHALEERRDRDAGLPAQPAPAEADARRCCARGVDAPAAATGYDVDTHFNPRYGPWDQRLCLVPDGDLFKAITRGRGVDRHRPRSSASRPTGVRLASGAELDADIIVTATGLNLLAIGGIELSVDGEPVSLPERLAYKGMMLSRRAELRVHDRLHERVVDAEGRPRGRVRVPPARAHGAPRLPPVHAGRRRPGASSAARCWTSPPATSSARSTCSRRAARARRGGSG